MRRIRVAVLAALAAGAVLASPTAALPQTQCFRYPMDGTVRSVVHDVTAFTRVSRTALTGGGNWVICWRERDDLPNAADVLVYVEPARAPQRRITFLPILPDGG